MPRVRPRLRGRRPWPCSPSGSQQTARGRLIGRDRGEAETDVGLAAKISGTRHARTTPMAANAKPAQAFHAKKGRGDVFFTARRGPCGTKVPGAAYSGATEATMSRIDPWEKAADCERAIRPPRTPTKDDPEELALSLDRAGQRKRVHEPGRVRPRKRDDWSSARRAGALPRPLAPLASASGMIEAGARLPV